MNKEGKIVVVLGASNSGKTTMYNYLKKFSSKIYVPTYYTTRDQRKNEIDGISYHFVSNDVFNEKISSGEILFSYECHGFKYGIPNDIVKNYQNGKIILLGLSRKLIKKIKLKFKNVIVIFLDVEYNELKRRLNRRNREKNSKEIVARLNKAKEMIEWSKITNDIDIKINNENSLYEFLKKIL